MLIAACQVLGSGNEYLEKCQGTPAFLAPEMMRPNSRYRLVLPLEELTQCIDPAPSLLVESHLRRDLDIAIVVYGRIMLAHPHAKTAAWTTMAGMPIASRKRASTIMARPGCCTCRGRPTDIYALGACLFTFVYGRIPFTAPTVYQLFQVCFQPNYFHISGSWQHRPAPSQQALQRFLLH